MRILILSSILVLFGCSSKTSNSISHAKVNNTCLINSKATFESVLFNTQVNVINHHLSGLLLMKRIQNDTIRVVFTNELGIKYFDFEFTQNNFRVIDCIRKLKKKIIIEQLKKNFNLILMNHNNISEYQLVKTDSTRQYRLDGKKEQTYYITDTTCSKVLRIETANEEKKKIVIYLNGEKNGIADNIFIHYQTFRFDINLKQIDR